MVYVVDSGMVKQKDYNPQTGMDSLGVTPISRWARPASPRAGCAGSRQLWFCPERRAMSRF